MKKTNPDKMGRRRFTKSIIGTATFPLIYTETNTKNNNDNKTDRHIFINGTESNEKADYEFTVSGEIREGWTDYTDGEINDATATGTVWGSWQVDYIITGELLQFDSTGEVIVYSTSDGLTPKKLYPENWEHSLDNHLFIKGNSTKTTYELSVTEDLQPGWTNEGDDTTEENSASGTVWGGKYDDYFYNGDIDNISFDGDVTLILNGNKVEAEAVTNNQPNPKFVETVETQFQFNEQSFHSVGTNSFWSSYQYWDKSAIDETIQEANNLGLNTLRVWGFGSGSPQLFQPEPREYNENAFKRFDYLIQEAKKNDVKLIVALGNYWADFGGIDQYVEWSDKASERTDFYSDVECQSLYKGYIQYFLTRKNTLTDIEYRNEPAIMMWELLNEPRNPSATDGDGSLLHSWAHDTASFIKNIDADHLVSTGVEGFILGATTEYDEIGWWMNTQGYDFSEIHSSNYIDACSIHLYPDNWRISNEAAIQFLKDRARDAQNLEKPMYIGEFGKRVDRDASNVSEQMDTRNSRYKQWYDIMQREKVDGAAFWQLVPDQYLYDGDKFSVTLPDDKETADIIREGAEKLWNSN